MSLQLRKELDEIRSSLAQYLRLTDALEERKAAIEAQLDEIRYPTLTLPPEITSEIFCSIHSSQWHCNASFIGGTPYFPLHLPCLAYYRPLHACAVGRSLHDLEWQEYPRPQAPQNVDPIGVWLDRACTLPNSTGQRLCQNQGADWMLSSADAPPTSISSNCVPTQIF
ncbi:hypothetical protein C8J57DRAFT_1504226 [Mycena rebaudengoi]|nr:hypothetical protein C8J57DRAFT_1504226 [Mycena rebaudengoi]